MCSVIEDRGNAGAASGKLRQLAFWPDVVVQVDVPHQPVRPCRGASCREPEDQGWREAPGVSTVVQAADVRARRQQAGDEHRRHPTGRASAGQ